MTTRKSTTAIATPMTFVRETKNTYRYDADDAATAAVLSIYVLKRAFTGDVPANITVTVSE